MQAKYVVDSIFKIMINRIVYFYYYTPYATQATAQRGNSESRAELAPAMPSAGSVDRKNGDGSHDPLFALYITP